VSRHDDNIIIITVKTMYSFASESAN